MVFSKPWILRPWLQRPRGRLLLVRAGRRSFLSEPGRPLLRRAFFQPLQGLDSCQAELDTQLLGGMGFG